MNHSTEGQEGGTDIFEELLQHKPLSEKPAPRYVATPLSKILDAEHEEILALAQIQGANSNLG